MIERIQCSTCSEMILDFVGPFGQSLQSCKCYVGPMQGFTPPAVIDAAMLAEWKAQEQALTKPCLCAHCGGPFLSVSGARMRITCSPECLKARGAASQATRRAEHKAGRPRGKTGRKPVDAECPRCGAKRVRSASRPNHPLGIWRCHPCERADFHARKAKKLAAA